MLMESRMKFWSPQNISWASQYNSAEAISKKKKEKKKELVDLF